MSRHEAIVGLTLTAGWNQGPCGTTACLEIYRWCISVNGAGPAAIAP